MEQGVSAQNIHLQPRGSGGGLYECLQRIQKKEEQEKREKDKKNAKGIVGDPDLRSKGDESETEENQHSLADKLLEALKKNDALKVWELIELNNKDIKTIKCFDKADAEKENNNEGGGCDCEYKCDSSPLFCRCVCCGCQCKCPSCSKDKRQSKTQEKNNQEKMKWMEILSNPLFISLEWLWKRNVKCGVDGREKVRKNVDIIQSALDDACLVEKIASYEHHYSRDEYKSAVNAFETFATDIIEQTTSTDHYDVKIMDIEGNGCLLTGKPGNFIQSLSLLKIAAKNQRKKFVASPRSQFILNEIIYYKWEDWQDKSTWKKILWFLFQFFVLIPILSLFYIFYRVCKKICCSNMCSQCSDANDEYDKLPHQEGPSKICWLIKSLYEHPYSKFVNHTMSYILFVALLIASTFGFEKEYRTSTTGLAFIDYVVLGFVGGLMLQEIWEALKQGCRVYFTKWWNIVDTVTLLTFVVAYAVWLTAWGIYGEWKPRKSPFLVADVLYASAAVMAFFHLTHYFQVSSTLGPLQLSLYRMLKDVLKFLLIFLMLYIAFMTGVVKIYSYYVASQIKLRDQDNSHFQEYHPYAKHENTLIGLVWLLIGYVEEDKIVVDDPAFALTSIFGRIGLVAYVVCTAIVALNMLIAMMNNSFDKVMADADVEWKFSRAQMWLEWIDKGNAIPVPFNILYYVVFVALHVFSLPCFILKRIQSGRWPCCSTDLFCKKTTDVKQGRRDRTRTQSKVELMEMASEGGDENQTRCCMWSYCLCTCETRCGHELKSNVAARKERIDAMEYLVRRYVSEKYLSGFEGKFDVTQ